MNGSHDELLKLAQADIGISVALEHASAAGTRKLLVRQAAIHERMRQLQREIIDPDTRHDSTLEAETPEWLSR